MTALLGALPALDLGSRGSGGTCVAAIDLDKAYDSVARAPMDGVLGYLGITSNPFYRLYC